MMKVKELIAWLSENASPDDDVVLLDASNPDNPPEVSPYLHDSNLVYEEDDATVLICYFGEDVDEDDVG
jgi:hypothetical protein